MIDSKKLSQTFLVIIGLLIGLYATVAILLNPTGGISGLSKLITIVGILIGLVNPRMGLYFLAAQTIYSDEIKRIGVYFGVASTQTVSEILIGPLLTLCAVNLSFLYGILRKRYFIDRLGLLLYLLVPAIGIVLLVKSDPSGTLAMRAYGAASTALYITIVPICYGLFQKIDDWADFVAVQVILATPAAAWGIWQYFNGFNTIEWTYALSGLSLTHSYQMSADDPRVFGLFGSASAFSCVGLYGAFSAWLALRSRRFRIIFFVITLVYFAAIFFSKQRTILFLPLIVVLFSYAFRWRISTIAIYLAGITTFIIGVFNADNLLYGGIDTINSMISSEGRWGSQVLNVNTYSDRLRGWKRLTEPESWSLFGTAVDAQLSTEKVDVNAQDYNHDVINAILINFGGVGLFLCTSLFVIILVLLHRVIFKCKDSKLRREGAFTMACIIPMFLLAAVGGSPFNTNPINLQIWSIFAGVFIIRKLVRQSITGLPMAKKDIFEMH